MRDAFQRIKMDPRASSVKFLFGCLKSWKKDDLKNGLKRALDLHELKREAYTD